MRLCWRCKLERYDPFILQTVRWYQVICRPEPSEYRGGFCAEIRKRQSHKVSASVQSAWCAYAEGANWSGTDPFLSVKNGKMISGPAPNEYRGGFCGEIRKRNPTSVSICSECLMRLEGANWNGTILLYCKLSVGIKWFVDQNQVSIWGFCGEIRKCNPTKCQHLFRVFSIHW